MKKRLIIYSPLVLIITLLVLTQCGEKSSDSQLAQQFESDLTPLEVVNKRMDLFNAHNYGEFIKLYNTNVEVYTYPDKMMGKGSDRLASIFKTDFENKSVSVEIVNQMDNGPYVLWRVSSIS